MQVSSEEAAAAPEPEPLDAYVMVEKDDVMDAMATFVAAYLMQLPEAQHLKPQELQQALGGAIAVRRSWGPGRRAVTLTSSAFENPASECCDCGT